ncbi:glycosyltransferase [Myroides odoratimimus]|uniref:glycosyltransferase n=1 Tax=Myroides odoratimimus TaxID=76832 RepID=UPI003D2F5CF8
MKVLHVIDSLATGGAEKLLVESLPVFRKNNVDIDIALLNGKVTPFYNVVKDFGYNRIYNLYNGSVYNPITILRLVPILKKYGVVHVHLFPAQYYVVIAKVLGFSKCKLIFTEHSTSNRRLQNRRLRWIEKIVYSFYKKVISITPEVQSELKEKLNLPDNKLTVIENGVNIANIESAESYSRENLGYNEDDRIILMVAGFRREKDHDTLIRCLSILPLNYKLLLVGDGERRKELETLVEFLRLEERIKFLGVRTDVYNLMKMVDISVLSSHWEGFGLVAVEAMSAGKPVIASKVQGLEQVVEGGGLLFTKGDEIDLKNKILELEENEYYHEISKSCVVKAKKYDINNTVSKLISLYEKI